MAAVVAAAGLWRSWSTRRARSVSCRKGDRSRSSLKPGVCGSALT